MSAPDGPLTDLRVLFDWNGTLMSDRRRALQATNEVLLAHGLATLSEAEFTERFRLPLADLLVSLGIAREHREAAQRRWNAGLVRNRAPLRADAADVLESLVAQGAVTGVVSAADRDTVQADLDRSGEGGVRVRRCLRFVVGDADDKVAHLLRHRHGRPGAVYVGDTDYDIRCARRAGYLAVALAGGYQDRKRLYRAEPDVVVDSLAELPEFLMSRSDAGSTLDGWTPSAPVPGGPVASGPGRGGRRGRWTRPRR